MTRDALGWAEHVTRDARAGTCYRFRIDSDLLVPDPASRFQPSDVHGPSEVVDPLAHGWTDAGRGGVAAERLVFFQVLGVGRRQGHGLGLTSTTWGSLPAWSVGCYLDERAP